MNEKNDRGTAPAVAGCTSRRDFLRGSALAGAAGLAAAVCGFPARAAEFVGRDSAEVAGREAADFTGQGLRVWSCGGLAEAMMPAHEDYERLRGVRLAYTGAFAAALGKSLLGSGRTEVFCGRVLELARNLKEAGRLIGFKPLCYTTYVIVTPKGNPKKIAGIEDMAKPGIRVAMAPEASPPGGAAVMGILKKAGLTEQIMANTVSPGTCVQTSVTRVADGGLDAMIVELRIPLLARFAGQLEVVELPFELFPPGPLTFTIGMMREAKNPEFAQDYIDWITSAQGGQPYFERAGFIPADSDRGRELTELLGVKDV
jgi:molybdate transport system substrate-binding protein